jgi:hypothetical protein
VDRKLTLENFLLAQMAAVSHKHDGWRTRQRLAERGVLLGPDDLERGIVPTALACRYRRLLEQTIDLFGGTDRVHEHLTHLRECRRRGKPPEPEPSPDQVRAAAAGAAWRALTMGLLP